MYSLQKVQITVLAPIVELVIFSVYINKGRCRYLFILFIFIVIHSQSMKFSQFYLVSLVFIRLYLQNLRITNQCLQSNISRFSHLEVLKVVNCKMLERVKISLQ